MKSPKILYRYVGLEFIKAFLLSLFALTLLVIITELFDEIKSLMECKASLFIIAKYLFYKTPFVMLKTTPFASLIGTLFSLSKLTKTNEVMAMKTSGINMLRIILPILIITFIMSVSMIVLNETIAADMFWQSNIIKYQDIFKTKISYAEVKNNLSYRSEDGWIAYIKVFNGERGFMNGITIIYLDDDNNITKRVDAEKAVWNGTNWTFENCYTREFKNNINKEVAKKHNLIVLPIKEKPEDFSKRKKKIDEFTIRELSEVVQKLKTKGEKYNEELVNMHFKISFAFSTFLIALLAIPFGITAGKYGSVIISFALGFTIGFVYWQFLGFGEALGRNGVLSPILAAWLPNIVFALIGSAMIFNVRK